ncbi:uncharacterized protein LOC62_03G003552 [Vanrija pseudolonga]|uniref:Uncharacterized protein n=1 Tax=Vanrija pseudolonga TaxID=143232 RepID=A0AAF1BKU9_9TREE|nr:hypothetical protein LOC62_03G003552 [Vanrija pseudolonga]
MGYYLRLLDAIFWLESIHTQTVLERCNRCHERLTDVCYMCVPVVEFDREVIFMELNFRGHTADTAVALADLFVEIRDWQVEQNLADTVGLSRLRVSD